MALTGNEWAALAGVFVVIFAVLVYNVLRGQKAPIQSAAGDEEHSVDPRLSRFVVHGGDVVGETVAIAGDRLILKQAGVFKAVPESQAVLAGEEVEVTGDIDWAAAEEEGTRWLEGNRAGQHDEVTSDLTRSEDVKAPAREAFEKRQKELSGGADEEE